ncbi:hypothetical protein LZC95_05680 [Pendulispora brunnea]|uniref:protein-tyrosine-phosphatase n=1 Tax=Pendulispora brunnea TaxID=2905690 RepID=A0ABZ2KCI1_9BACT
MTHPFTRRIGMFGLGLCYFLWYAPYSAVAKAMSGGLFDSTHGPIGGFVLLPAAAIGTLCAMPLTITILGWWKYARHRTIFGRSVPFLGRETAAAAFWMSLIVGTTTLNFTFPGVSILLMLVLMRIETLIISPTVDLIRERRIPPHSWVAIGLSGLSAIVALADVNNYKLTLTAALSLLAYMLGYTNRFLIMSRHAKSGSTQSDRQYFVEEHMATPVFLVALLAVPAFLGSDSISRSLHDGFTTFLVSPAALPALAIGVLYEGLFVCTTLIFLDPREYSFCMPVHVCSSMLAGVAASLALHAAFGLPAPSTATFAAALCVVLAACALGYPAISRRLIARARTDEVLLFVCGGNAIRSPMAAALARVELAALGKAHRTWRVESAGVAVHEPGGPLSRYAAVALRKLNVPVPEHTARSLTADLCEKSAAVYCMTRAHRAAVLEMAPTVSDRVMCLDPKDDVAEPKGDAIEAYVECAVQLRMLVRARLFELPPLRQRLRQGA